MKKYCMIAPLVASLAVAGTLMAQTPPAAPPVFMRISVSSVETVNKLVAALGVTLPAPPQAMLEQMPLIGRGGVATDKPGGFELLATSALASPSPAGVFIIPVTTGHATPQKLKAAGGRAVPGHADTFTLSGAMAGITARREADYLIFGKASAAQLAGITESAITADNKTPGAVATISVNFEALRKNAPAAWKQLLAAEMGNKTPTDPSEKMGRDSVVNVTQKLNRISTTISYDEQNLHLQTWVLPVTLAAPSVHQRPNFPKDVVAQVNLALTQGMLAGAIDSFADVAFRDEAMSWTPPSKRAEMRGTIKQMLKLLLGGDEVSVAVALHDAKPVIYVVDQRAKPEDAAAELPKLVASINSASTDKAKIQTYQASGKKVTRVILPGSTPFFVDMLQVGNATLFTLSPSDAKEMESFMALGMGGDLGTDVVCSGSVDLGGVAQAAQSSGANNPMFQMGSMLAGQQLTWTAQVSPEGHYLYVDTQIPMPVVKMAAPMLASALSPRHAVPLSPSESTQTPAPVDESLHAPPVDESLNAPPPTTPATPPAKRPARRPNRGRNRGR